MKSSLFLFLSVILTLSASLKSNAQGVMISNDPAAPDPSALLQTYGPGTGDGNVLFTGEWKGAPGPVPAINAGTRLLWYPDKAAFRVGRVTGTQWNTENIGNYSSAGGFNTTASGSFANAWGSVTTASGAQATAWGFNNIASGTSATAWGENTTAPSFAETVFGFNNTVYTPVSNTAWVAGDRLFVIGNGSAGNSDALVMLKNGNTGLGTSSPTQRLEVAGSIYGQSSNWAIRGLKTGSGTFPGVWGETESASANANGIRGFANNTSSGSGSAGVFGKNFGTANTNYGVLGEAVSVLGRGVYGLASATSGTNTGVYGQTASSDGYAGYFTGPEGSSNYFQRNVGINTNSPTSLLHVVSTATNQPIIRAEASEGISYDGTAIFGKAASMPNSGTGGYFQGGKTAVRAYLVGTGTSNLLYGVRSEITGGNQGGIRYGGQFIIEDSYSTNYAVFAETSGIISTNYAGYFNGNVTVTGTFSNPSDLSLKQNIRKIDNSLEKIIRLQGKMYENRCEEYAYMNLIDGTQFGFIAQELEEVFPELVTENIHPGTDPYYDSDIEQRDPLAYKGINYIGMIPVLVEAIKELNAVVEAQNKRIEELEREKR